MVDESAELRRILRQQRERVKTADALMLMAARKSTETGFGWSHHDCVIMADAARMLRGDPEPTIDDKPVGVLSTE